MTDAEITSLINGVTGAVVVVMFVVVALFIAALVLEIVGLCKTFKKAGKPAWAAIVPIYNIVVLLDIIKMPWWHIFIYVLVAALTDVKNDVVSLIGTVGMLVYSFVFAVKLAHSFGKSTGFGVFTAFFPFIGYMILGCGSAEYQK